MVSGKHRAYSTRPGLILGFHGTDQSIVHDVVLQKITVNASMNTWDWLGHGVYFWEHSSSRAMEFAETSSKRKSSRIKTPAVLGAVLDLGNCFDLLDYDNLSVLKRVYNSLPAPLKFLRNKQAANDITRGFHIRELDCAVIEEVHEENQYKHLEPFDSVRAAFLEGSRIYPTAGFREKNHIQICIRNPNCIKGFFLPLK